MRAHSLGLLVTGFALALVSFSPGRAQAQTEPARPAVQQVEAKPIGKVVTATGSITIERAGAVVVQAAVPGQAGQTKVGDLVYLGDVVQTGADGKVGINFTDGTSFNLSSNARMALNEFVYDPNGKSNSTLLSLSKGTFTFVAGNVAKTGDMKIDTPVATMGIRGTTPHVEISDDGSVKFSTLIEEGKHKLARKSAASPVRQPEQPAEPKLNLNICRRCLEHDPDRCACAPVAAVRSVGGGADCEEGQLSRRISRCVTAWIARRSIPGSAVARCSLMRAYGTTAAQAIAYNNRGNAYIAKGEFDRAIEDFDRSIKLDRTYIKPLNNRGVAYMKKGEHELAIEAFDEVIRLDPNYVNAFANRAAAYLKKHDYARAAQDFDEAIRLSPGLEPVSHGRCWARAILGDLEAALEACNKALQSGLNKAATYDSLGLIRLKMDQPGAAIDDYSSALRIDPKLASALYGRGLARLRNGDQAGSDADISAAKTIAAGIDEDFARYGVR